MKVNWIYATGEERWFFESSQISFNPGDFIAWKCNSAEFWEEMCINLKYWRIYFYKLKKKIFVRILEKSVNLFRDHQMWTGYNHPLCLIGERNELFYKCNEMLSIYLLSNNHEAFPLRSSLCKHIQSSHSVSWTKQSTHHPSIYEEKNMYVMLFSYVEWSLRSTHSNQGEKSIFCIFENNEAIFHYHSTHFG